MNNNTDTMIQVRLEIITQSEEQQLPPYEIRSIFDDLVDGYEVKGFHYYRPSASRRSNKSVMKFEMNLFKVKD